MVPGAAQSPIDSTSLSGQLIARGQARSGKKKAVKKSKKVVKPSFIAKTRRAAAAAEAVERESASASASQPGEAATNPMASSSSTLNVSYEHSDNKEARLESTGNIYFNHQGNSTQKLTSLKTVEVPEGDFKPPFEENESARKATSVHSLNQDLGELFRPQQQLLKAPTMPMHEKSIGAEDSQSTVIQEVGTEKQRDFPLFFPRADPVTPSHLIMEMQPELVGGQTRDSGQSRNTSQPQVSAIDLSTVLRRLSSGRAGELNSAASEVTAVDVLNLQTGTDQDEAQQVQIELPIGLFGSDRQLTSQGHSKTSSRSAYIKPQYHLASRTSKETVTQQFNRTNVAGQSALGDILQMQAQEKHELAAKSAERLIFGGQQSAQSRQSMCNLRSPVGEANLAEINESIDLGSSVNESTTIVLQDDKVPNRLDSDSLPAQQEQQYRNRGISAKASPKQLQAKQTTGIKSVVLGVQKQTSQELLTPVRSQKQTPAKTPVRTPAKTPAKAPLKQQVKSPVKQATKSPSKTSVRTSAVTPAKAQTQPKISTLQKSLGKTLQAQLTINTKQELPRATIQLMSLADRSPSFTEGKKLTERSPKSTHEIDTPQSQGMSPQGGSTAMRAFLPDLKIEDLQVQPPASKGPNPLPKAAQSGAAKSNLLQHRQQPNARFKVPRTIYDRLSKLNKAQQDLLRKSQASQQSAKPATRSASFKVVKQQEADFSFQQSDQSRTSSRQRGLDKSIVESPISTQVVEAVSTVLARKRLLAEETSDKQLSIRARFNRGEEGSSTATRVQKSDIREILKELRLIGRQERVGGDGGGGGVWNGGAKRAVTEIGIHQAYSVQSEHGLSRYEADQYTQAFQQHETLIEQIEALFFTQKVNSIEHTFIQDFFIVLLSSSGVDKHSEQVTIIQKIIQESLQTATAQGQSNRPIKLASQRLFQLTQADKQPLTDQKPTDQAANPIEVEEIQQQMQIAELERQLISQMLTQCDKLRKLGAPPPSRLVSEQGSTFKSAKVIRKKRQAATLKPQMIQSSCSMRSKTSMDTSPTALVGGGLRGRQSFIGEARPSEVQQNEDGMHKSAIADIIQGANPVEQASLLSSHISTMNEEFEEAYREALRRSTQHSPRSSIRPTLTGASRRSSLPNDVSHTGGVISQEEDVIQSESDDSNEFACLDNSVLGLTPQDTYDSKVQNGLNQVMSQASSDSTPRGASTDSEGSGRAASAQNRASVVVAHSPPSHSAAVVSDYLEQPLLSEEVHIEDEEVDTPYRGNTPNKNMSGVGHIGSFVEASIRKAQALSSVASNSAYDQVSQNGGKQQANSSSSSWLKSKGRHSANLSKNMRQFQRTNERQSNSLNRSFISQSQMAGSASSYCNLPRNGHSQARNDQEFRSRGDRFRTSMTAFDHLAGTDQSFVNSFRNQNSSRKEEASPLHANYSDFDDLKTFRRGEGGSQLEFKRPEVSQPQAKSQNGPTRVVKNSITVKQEAAPLKKLIVPGGGMSDLKPQSKAVAAGGTRAMAVAGASGYFNKSRQEVQGQSVMGGGGASWKGNSFGQQKAGYFGGDDEVVERNEIMQSTQLADFTQLDKTIPKISTTTTATNKGYFGGGPKPPHQPSTRQPDQKNQRMPKPSTKASMMTQAKSPYENKSSTSSNFTAGKRSKTTAKQLAEDTNLKYHIDIQVSPKKMLVVKIYKGDKADEILRSLKGNSKELGLSEEDFSNIERVIRLHTDR